MEARQLPKLTKNQKNILVAAEKKRFCDQRALHIVELLIEPVLDPAWLLHQLQFIEQQHYEDVTEERACTGCCGYPLCQSRLGRVPHHQYRISTNTNRIYDWSERKKFCSNACFRASRHLKPQIPTTPLWLRDTEPPPVFRLLHGEHNRRGVAGDVVELAVARAPADDPPAEHVTATEVATDMMHQFDELSERIRDLPLKPEQQSDTAGQSAPHNKQRRSCLRRPAASAGDGATREADRTETGRECQTPAGDVASDGRRVEFSETRGGESQDGVPPGDTDVSQKAETDVESSSSPVNTPRRPGTDVSAESPRTTEPAAVQPPASREEASPSARTSGFKRPERAPQRRQQHPLQVVEARLLDWLSGGAPGAPVPPAVPLRVEIPSGGAGHADTAPVPASAATPAITPQEAAARNQALLAYLQGSVRLPPAAPPARPSAAAEEQLTEGGRPVPPEPLLESQDRQRRRIVNDHLGKATGRLLAPLGLLMSDVAGPLRQLVASFHLTATNVTMSPSQWSLASLVLLRCLLRVDGQLAGLARGTDAAFSSALRPLQLTPASLDRLTVRLVALLQARHPRGPATPSPGAASDGPAAAAAGSS